MVMDGDHRIGIFFTKCAYYVVGAFLHLRIGALYGIQLDAAAVTPRIHG